MVKNRDIKINKIMFIMIHIVCIIGIVNIINFANKEPKKEVVVDQVLFRETNKNFDEKDKYYVSLKYKKFKSLWKSKDLSTIAVVDKSSPTYNEFKKMINKIAYYHNIKIYLLETNSLNKKDEVDFYKKDERFHKLKTNYIINISNKEIKSITIFDDKNIEEIIEKVGK